MLCLLILVSAFPRAVVAQQPEPAAQPSIETPAEEAKNPPRTEAAKSEEENNDQYRHAPIVESLAKLMHMDVETAARTFEIFNVSVVVLGIVIPLIRIMPRLLRGRTQKIQVDMESARKTTEDANRRLSAVEAKLASLDGEIAKFRSEVEEQIAQDEQRGKAALEEERTRIVASAEAEISVAAAQAKRSLRTFAADLAIDQAAKQLVLTPETDRALIAQFVNEAGRDGMNGGGRA
ncbi:MAG: ATP synthase F0 subunit B [Acidobacteria bacterium]|nr:ATP synthase F0 subunit B [Acidobacteriota bacterium]